MSDPAPASPRVSVIMRAHNDCAFVERTLAGLSRQRFRDFEVLFCDDHSTDGTREILGAYPDATLLPPDPDGYVPGRVLNRAVKAARGSILVFNNADAVILDELWLEHLIAPFCDSDVAAVYANQLPRADAWGFVRRDHEAAFGNGEIAAQWRFFFSLASSAIRRELLMSLPFDETIQYSEDVEWAWRIHNEKRKIVYAPDARVEHSHNYSLKSCWKRFYNEGIADGVIFHDTPSFRNFLRSTFAAIGRDEIYLCRHRALRCLFHAPLYRLIQKWAHYRGLQEQAKRQAAS